MTGPAAAAGPFAGVEVIELTSGIAGPMAGMLLALRAQSHIRRARRTSQDIH